MCSSYLKLCPEVKTPSVPEYFWVISLQIFFLLPSSLSFGMVFPLHFAILNCPISKSFPIFCYDLLRMLYHYQISLDPRRFCLDVIITSRVSVEDGRKVYIALDVLGFPVMGRLRATFRIFYVVDYHPRPISPV